MKSIDRLSVDILNFGNRAVDNIVKAQRDTAETIWEDVIANAPYKTGEYISSIKVGDTTQSGYTINTTVYTDATVIAKASGKSYNLGQLLEEGTMPHEIYPVESSVLRWIDVNGEVRFAKHVHHPGTVSQPHFLPALNKNRSVYIDNIRKAIKEAK